MLNILFIFAGCFIKNFRLLKNEFFYESVVNYFQSLHKKTSSVGIWIFIWIFLIQNFQVKA